MGATAKVVAKQLTLPASNKQFGYDLNGDGSDVWIDRFKMGQRTGSHHMNVFRVNTIVHLSGHDGDVVQGGGDDASRCSQRFALTE